MFVAVFTPTPYPHKKLFAANPIQTTVFINPLVNYFRNRQEIHSSQAAVKETSYYGTLETLLNENGRAGERFTVRNSTAKVVIEEAGDHLCQYT
ncbi:hypothetical protein RVR34_00770 [Microcystis aeruginosa FBCC-A68]|uniref:GltB/FmdC/FwdC-like GXGXG domain-containing protein n=1 Tax=Microcystis sp. LE19-195.1E TaxID=3016440 RepID=UPI001649B3FB